MNGPVTNGPVMSKRVTRWLLALYPRAWRDRYGPEVSSLTEELIRAGETTPLPAGLNLVAGAAVERARALAASRTALTVSSAAVIVALVGGAFTLTGGARPTPAPRALASSGCLMEPALRFSVSDPGLGRLGSPVTRPQFRKLRRLGRGLAAPVAVRADPPVMIVRLARGNRILRLVVSARPASVLMTKSGLARPPEPKVARTAEPGPPRPAEPAWAGPVPRSCQQVTAVPNPVSGRTQKLRGVPPVPVATRVTR